MDQGFGHSSSPQICHCNLAERHKCLSNSHGGIEVRGAYKGPGADDVLLTGEESWWNLKTRNNWPMQ